MIKINTNNPTTNKAAELWGMRSQLNILTEECSEVIKAISKINRMMDEGAYDQEVIDNLSEEMADVFVCTMSVIKIMDAKEKVEKAMDFKLGRLEKRIIKIMGPK